MRSKFFHGESGHIDRKYVLITEGLDDAVFLEMVLEETDSNPDDLGICYAGGKEKIGSFLDLFLMSPGVTSKAVKGFAIFVDADESHQKTLDAIHKILVQRNFPKVEASTVDATGDLAIGIYLFPSLNQNGTLEDLMITETPNDPELLSARTYFDSLEKVHLDNHGKRIVQIALASKKGKLCAGIGRGIRNGAFSVPSKVAKELASFVNLVRGRKVDEEALN